jgi:hypothetical protein
LATSGARLQKVPGSRVQKFKAQGSGSHHIFLHPDLPELVNLQEVKGKAKPYQIKQLLKIIEKYNLHMENSE